MCISCIEKYQNDILIPIMKPYPINKNTRECFRINARRRAEFDGESWRDFLVKCQCSESKLREKVFTNMNLSTFSVLKELDFSSLLENMNITNATTISSGLNKGDWIKVFLLSAFFCVAVFANFHVGISISKTIKRRISPMHKLLLHLCISDLFVVGSIIPSEISIMFVGFSSFGDFFCKGVQFLRTFSLNLSSLIILCISLDRYFVIVQPFRSIEASQRVVHMLFWSYFTSIIWAFPQLIIYRMEFDTENDDTSCLSVWMGQGLSNANALIKLAIQYFIPFTVIVCSYSQIFYKISNTSVTVYSEANSILLRRSGQTVIDRARMKTIKLNLIIVVAFLACYSPNAIIVLWNMFDSKSATTMVSPYVKDALFHLMVANSCCNPLLYRLYTKQNDASQMSTTTNTIELVNSVHLSRDQHSRNRNN